MRPVDVAVVGGGAIGCSVAYHAALRGARVALFEAREVGSGSSGALAGMLSGQGEAEEPGPLRDLLVRGREYHRVLAARLYDDSGVDPGYVWNGALRTATDAPSAQQLAKEHSWHRQDGLSSEFLSGDEARRLEPALSDRIVAGLYLPDDGNLNPPQLVRALVQGAIRHGAEIYEYTSVKALATKGQRVTGIITPQGVVMAGSVVLAAGSTSDALSEQLGIVLPVYPMKGQLLETRISPVPIKANVWNHGNYYVVPKKDGRVIVGATEEPMSRDRRPTLGGIAELCRVAHDIVPALTEALFLRAWGGLRPATPSGAPLLGPADGREGLLLATGHHRNGVLLSALTGLVIAAMALGEPSPFDVAPFSPDAASREVV